MEIILAFFCGAIIPFIVQAWVFYNDKKKERANLKALFVILNTDLKMYYQKLFIGELQYCCVDPQWLFLNFKDFNTVNKHAMWPELMKSNVFLSNLEIFERINSIIHTVDMLNEKIHALKPERHNLNSGSIDVHNYRDLMNEIRSLYVLPKGGNISYQESPIGEFLEKAIKNIR